jgi:hypothetical protein
MGDLGIEGRAVGTEAGRDFWIETTSTAETGRPAV